MAKDDTDIVSALRAALADRVGRQRFELWFGASARLELQDGALTVGVPNAFFLDFLRINFREHLEAACDEVLPLPARIEFRVDRDLPNPGDCTRGANPSGKAAHPNGSLGSASTDDEDSPPRKTAPCNRTHGRRRFADLDTFVVGESNRLAHAAAKMGVERPGEMSPLVIHGPTSVGKTHLLEGIWTASRRRRRSAAAVYLSAEQFATGFLQALRGGGLPSFRRKYRGVDLLIIDDVQFLGGKKHTLVELLYTIDSMIREGRQLVFACDRPPAEMADVSAELVTRLESGMVCRIERPDYETRLGIVRGLARRQGLVLPEDVAELIATRLTGHARELSGALCRLQAAGRAWGKPLTRATAEETLADLFRAGSRLVRLTDIDRAVCQAFGLEPKTLQSTRKAKRISHPRMLAMWLARKYTRSALVEIGHYFGRRSHTTVLSAQKRVDGWLSQGASLALADHDWNVDEAIRQVERRLQAG